MYTKLLLILFIAPNITFAGGSGIAHIDPVFWFLIYIVPLILIGFVFFVIYSFFAFGIMSPRRKWYKERDRITEFLSVKGFNMIFSDMESGVILYKNNEQKIEINKYKNQWFIKADKNDLKSKDVFKAHKNIEDLNESLKKFI